MEKVSLDVLKTIKCDTVVVGGGVAGVAAAIASARHGAKTLLIESGGCLGGQATLGLVTPLDARCDTKGKSFGGLIAEIANETVKLSKKYCSAEEIGEHSDIASPHILKYVLLDLLTSSGADVSFHTTLLSADTEDGVITAVYAVTHSGIVKYIAKNYIDCSGDAQLCYLSGAEYVLGSEPNVFSQLTEEGLDKAHFSENHYSGYTKSGLMQPVSIFFLMGAVDVEKAMELNNLDLNFGDLGITKERFKNWQFAGTNGFEITDNRIPMPQGRVLVTRSNRSDVAVINMSRVINIDGSDTDSLNNGEIIAQKQVIALVDFLKTFIPGFEHSYYMQSGFTLGVRETKRMVGKYVLSGQDAIRCKTFANPVARGSYIIDIHDPSGKSRAVGGDIKGRFYDIPYGSIVSKNIKNLLAAGRCISADHIAHASTRIQGTCILTGQAAGTAAAICAKQNIFAESADEQQLHSALLEGGVYLD